MVLFGKIGYPKTYMGTVKRNEFWEIRVSQNIYGNRGEKKLTFGKLGYPKTYMGTVKKK